MNEPAPVCPTCTAWGRTIEPDVETIGILVACPDCHRLTWPNLGVNLPAGAAVAHAAGATSAKISITFDDYLARTADAIARGDSRIVVVDTLNGERPLGTPESVKLDLRKFRDPDPTENDALPGNRAERRRKSRTVTEQDRRAFEKRVAKRRGK